jgi:FkbM family methyltransferase
MWEKVGSVWDSLRSSLGRDDARVESGPGQGLRFYAGRDTSRFGAGEYEQPVQDALASLVKPADVCYDIGANLGFFSLLFARFTGPAGLVYAFEPVPVNVSAIRRNAKLNGFDNLEVMEIALSSNDGRVELLVAKHVGGAVLGSVGVPPPDLKGRRWVTTSSVDSLIERRKVRAPDVIKIDVEGAELDVLRGMERLLSERSPRLIIEVDDADRRVCEEKQAACMAFLEARAFEITPLPLAYPGTKWVVRHFVATKKQATLKSVSRRPHRPR